MALQERLGEILAPVKGHAAAFFLWGSHARQEAHARSDIDVCVVAGPGADVTALQRLLWREISAEGEELDVKIFEDLPLYLKGEVLDEGILIWAQDRQVLEDYLWRYRKLWRDARHRHDVSADEIRRALAG